MFSHSDLVDGYCNGSIHDNYHDLPQYFKVDTRVHVFVLPNQISWNTLHQQVDKEHLPPASSRMPDQVLGFMALDDTLMLHAFAKRVLIMQLL